MIKIEGFWGFGVLGFWGAGTSADFAETLPTYALEGSKHVYEVSENAPSLLGSNHIFFRLKISF